MLDKEISNSILTIGCEYSPPKGGIAQVLDTYFNTIFSNHFFIANSTEGGKVKKISICIYAFLKTYAYLILKKQIKIVHIHTASWNSFNRSTFFIHLAKLLRRKVVIHIHGGGFEEYYASNSEFIHKYLLMADCVIVLSESWKKFFRQEVGLDKVQIVHNIIPIPLLKTVENEGKLHGLFLGKICKEKGIYDLLQAIDFKRKELKDKFVLHIGGGGEVKQLLNVIKERNLQDLVYYEGWVDASHKSYLLNLCRLYILPSYVEGLPVSILEAMSYGEAILSTPVGGIPEVVTPNIGCLVQPGNITALAMKLQEFVSNPEMALYLGQQAKKKSILYLPQQVSQELYKIYKDLV